MIYNVRHTTHYTYSKPVDLAAHLLHLLPRCCEWQSVLSEKLTVTPDLARRVDRLDHFGNRVTWLFLDRAHGDFEVTSESVIDVRPLTHPDPAATPDWETVRQAGAQGGAATWQAAEFRFESPMAPLVAGARDYAAPSFAPGRPILAALMDLNERMFQDFTFRSGVTSVSTPIQRVLETRQGVCQDFTHLMLSAIRGLGLPACYTSGYIRTRPPPGKPRRRGSDQSHAWVGAWLGPEHGWVGLDPTNGVVVRDEHVMVALGRDFSDISPVRGMLLGGGKHTLQVGVDLEPAEPPMQA